MAISISQPKSWYLL